MPNEDKVTGIPESTDTVNWHGHRFALPVDVILKYNGTLQDSCFECNLGLYMKSIFLALLFVDIGI